MSEKDTLGTFGDITERLDRNCATICDALRARIVALHPEHVEIIWRRQRIASYGVGPKKMSEHYAYIAPQKNYVNLGFYHGASLSDPAGLLEGTGKKLRHIKIRNPRDAIRDEVIELLSAAIDDRKNA